MASRQPLSSATASSSISQTLPTFGHHRAKQMSAQDGNGNGNGNGKMRAVLGEIPVNATTTTAATTATGARNAKTGLAAKRSNQEKAKVSQQRSYQFN